MRVTGLIAAGAALSLLASAPVAAAQGDQGSFILAQRDQDQGKDQDKEGKEGKGGRDKKREQKQEQRQERREQRQDQRQEQRDQRKDLRQEQRDQRQDQRREQQRPQPSQPPQPDGQQLRRQQEQQRQQQQQQQQQRQQEQQRLQEQQRQRVLEQQKQQQQRPEQEKQQQLRQQQEQQRQLQEKQRQQQGQPPRPDQRGREQQPPQQDRKPDLQRQQPPQTQQAPQNEQQQRPPQDRRDGRDQQRQQDRPQDPQQQQRAPQGPRQQDGQQQRQDRPDDRARRLDDIRGERKERREGNRTVIQEGNRTIVREGDRTFIRRDESDRFRRVGRDVNVQRVGSETRTVVVGPNGQRIVTVTDPNGRLLRRSRFVDNREVVIIDNRPRGGRRPDAFFVALPALAIGSLAIPRERYIVEAASAPPEYIYGALMAPPVERLPRAYTLDEIRYSPELRNRMPRIDLDTITFDTGSWEITPDQYDRLAPIAEGIRRAIERNPNEVFLIEGHTDAVGSDEDNLSLSDRRAEAVSIILTDQFRIPPENLATQGYGEQQLKIPSDGPERANRRVTVRRITPLLQQGQAGGPPPQ